MGEVYRARDPRLDRDIALKLLPVAWASDPERRARFEREARAAAALSHPNICTIHDVGEADGRSDLFSFGVVLYEILAGRLPFTGRTSTAVIDAVLHQTPAPMPRSRRPTDSSSIPRARPVKQQN